MYVYLLNVIRERVSHRFAPVKIRHVQSTLRRRHD